MRCLNCNEYIPERRSFNAKKEPTTENYLNIKIIRFHIYCPRCNNTITFKTNPQTAGYLPEAGAVRNFEPTKKTSNAPPVETEDELFKRLEKEEEENSEFQILKNKRKNNPFWKANDSSNDKIESLQDRLTQQLHQQEMMEGLENLHQKYEDINSKGGKEVLTDQAIAKLGGLDTAERKLDTLKKRKLEEDIPLIKPVVMKKKQAVEKKVSVVGGYSSSDEE